MFLVRIFILRVVLHLARSQPTSTLPIFQETQRVLPRHNSTLPPSCNHSTATPSLDSVRSCFVLALILLTSLVVSPFAQSRICCLVKPNVKLPSNTAQIVKAARVPLVVLLSILTSSKGLATTIMGMVSSWVVVTPLVPSWYPLSLSLLAFWLYFLKDSK